MIYGILILLILFSACSEKVEEKKEVKYIKLYAGNNLNWVVDFQKEQFCPKVGDLFKLYKEKVYAVRCFENEKMFFFKTYFIPYNDNDITVKEYQFINNKMMLTQYRKFGGMYFKKGEGIEVRLPQYMSGDNKIASSTTGYGLISDESFHYEADSNGKFHPVYQRKLAGNSYELKKYNGSDFEDIIKETDVKKEYGKVTEINLDEDVLKAKTIEIKRAMQIFEAYDMDLDVYHQLSNLKNTGIFKTIYLYNQKQIEFEIQKNIDIDYTIPYETKYSFIEKEIK